MSSGCKARESQESEVGVSGRGLWVLWTQKLMHTKASAASRSLYSGVEEQDFSLSCLFLSIITSQMSTRLDRPESEAKFSICVRLGKTTVMRSTGT